MGRKSLILHSWHIIIRDWYRRVQMKTVEPIALRAPFWLCKRLNIWTTGLVYDWTFTGPSNCPSSWLKKQYEWSRARLISKTSWCEISVMDPMTERLDTQVVKWWDVRALCGKLEKRSKWSRLTSCISNYVCS